MFLTICQVLLSTNRMYYGRKVLTSEARAWKEGVYYEARGQGAKAIEGDLAVEIKLFFKDKRRRDVDNVKVLLDALTGVCWNDDSQIIHLTISKEVDVIRPRIEIKVKKI